MQNPILLISPEAAAISVAAALRDDLNLPVARASSRRAGLAMLRRGQYLLVALDESLAETDEVATDLIFQNAGTAPLIEIDFAAMPPARVVRHARSALQRRAQDEQRAREAAAASLEAELRGLLSGLLLESQLALREAKPEQAPKLRQVVQMAGDLRDRLRV
ncbi:MAG TPA: hypothetical protein VLI45_01275 [Acidobacteriaceae bacterium]|nr:hypothetical protein [Acidobacteriaceae bacterium]